MSILKAVNLPAGTVSVSAAPTFGGQHAGLGVSFDENTPMLNDLPGARGSVGTSTVKALSS